jgi:hypothetical protein
VNAISAEDVTARVVGCRKYGVPFAVASGRHTTSDASSCEGGLIIDLRSMRAVSVDPDARTITAAGGVALIPKKRQVRPRLGYYLLASHVCTPQKSPLLQLKPGQRLGGYSLYSDDHCPDQRCRGIVCASRRCPMKYDKDKDS